MEYVLAIAFIILLTLNIAVCIWSTKKNIKEWRMKSVAIYQLSLELKRLNNMKDGEGPSI